MQAHLKEDRFSITDRLLLLLSIASLVMVGIFYCPYLASGLGEGNGTPLQYSCLENPMDGGAW